MSDQEEEILETSKQRRKRLQEERLASIEGQLATGSKAIGNLSKQFSKLLEHLDKKKSKKKVVPKKKPKATKVLDETDDEVVSGASDKVKDDIFTNLIETAKESLADKNYFVREPNKEELMLRSAKISDILDFFEKQTVMRRQYKLAELATFIPAHLRKLILANVRSKGKDPQLVDKVFLKSTLTQCIRTITEAFQAEEPDEFLRSLIENVKFPNAGRYTNKYRMTMDGFLQFYEDVTVVLMEFGQLVTFHTAGNTKDVLPPLTTSKEGHGLLYLMQQVFPQTVRPYAQAKHAVLSKKTQKFDSFDQYKEELSALMTADREIVLSARRICRSFRSVNEYLDFLQKRNADSSLHNMVAEEDSFYGEEAETQNDLPDTDSLYAFGADATAKRPMFKSNGCLKKLYSPDVLNDKAKCSNKNCSYDHNERVLFELFKEDLSRLKKHPFWKRLGPNPLASVNLMESERAEFEDSAISEILPEP